MGSYNTDPFNTFSLLLMHRYSGNIIQYLKYPTAIPKNKWIVFQGCKIHQISKFQNLSMTIGAEISWVFKKSKVNFENANPMYKIEFRIQSI